MTRELAECLVAALRATREAHLEALSYREQVIVALGMIAERDRQLEAARRVADGLRQELRRYVSRAVDRADREVAA